MATREENMKKINDELEAMSDEQLEKVAGGNRDELALDTQLFNTMGQRFKAYTLEDITDANVNGISAKITSLYSKLGIQVSYNDFGASTYKVDGKATTRNKAVETALYRAGYHDVDPKPFQITF